MVRAAPGCGGCGCEGCGLVGFGLVGSGLVGSGLVGSGLVGSGLVGSGLVGSGLVGSGLVGSGSLGFVPSFGAGLVSVFAKIAAFWASVEASFPNCSAVSSALARAAEALACVAARPVMSAKDCFDSISNAALSPVGSGAAGALSIEMIGAGNAVGGPELGSL